MGVSGFVLFRVDVSLAFAQVPVCLACRDSRSRAWQASVDNKSCSLAFLGRKVLPVMAIYGLSSVGGQVGVLGSNAVGDWALGDETAAYVDAYRGSGVDALAVGTTDAAAESRRLLGRSGQDLVVSVAESVMRESIVAVHWLYSPQHFGCDARLTRLMSALSRLNVPVVLTPQGVPMKPAFRGRCSCRNRAFSRTSKPPPT